LATLLEPFKVASTTIRFEAKPARAITSITSMMPSGDIRLSPPLHSYNCERGTLGGGASVARDDVINGSEWPKTLENI
jgi:hypothetical protein